MATAASKRAGARGGESTSVSKAAAASTRSVARTATAYTISDSVPSGSAAEMDGIVEAVLRSFRSGPRERIEEIRRGVPARRISELSGAMDVPKERLVDSLGLSRATVNRKVQRGQPLSREESERVVGMQSLMGQVQAMAAEGGMAVQGFDAARWLAQWLAQPLPALGGDTPASYLDTVEGQKLVSRLLAMAESGAYA